MKKKSRFLSRRRFLAAVSVGFAGVWAGSTGLGTRAMRGLLEEARRRVASPSHTPTPKGWDAERVTVSWLGHSTVLLNFCGVTILTDPVLGKRVGASTPLGTAGPKRLVAPALRPSELPEIDLVLLSHAHMDHFDFPTLRRLPGQPRAVSAKGTDDLLSSTRLRQPVTLGWGEQTHLCWDHGDLTVRAFEVRHWGARWRIDRHRGYNGYVLEREGNRVIFGGDTAFTDSFRELRSGGAYDLAIMPIGAYHPWEMSHCTPEQAVRMANAAGAERFLPIHFKTFPLGQEPRAEPLERLRCAIEADRLALSEIGETCVLA